MKRDKLYGDEQKCLPCETGNSCGCSNARQVTEGLIELISETGQKIKGGKTVPSTNTLPGGNE